MITQTLGMDGHVSYEQVAQLANKYPALSGALFQTYNDLKLAQQWKDVHIVDLGDRPAVCGRRTASGDPDAILSVLPCSLSETLSLDLLSRTFEALSYPSHLILAVNAEDSSIVYYKISSGIVKPQL